MRLLFSVVGVILGVFIPLQTYANSGVDLNQKIPLSFFVKDSNVRGYTKKDGTYVAPHKRTTPNSTQKDNWSSKPNQNPYTGKSGTKEPKK